MKWYDQILASVKSFFALEHDATEQEVHEKLQSAKSLESFQAELRQSLEQEIRAEMLTELNAETERANAAEILLEAAKATISEQNSGGAELESRIEQLTATITAHEATIETLKKKPAEDHTAGEGGAPAPKNDKPYLNSAIYKQAMNIAGKQ